MIAHNLLKPLQVTALSALSFFPNRATNSLDPSNTAPATLQNTLASTASTIPESAQKELEALKTIYRKSGFSPLLELNELIDRYPRFFDARIFRFQLKAENGDLDGARSEFKALVILQDNSPKIIFDTLFKQAISESNLALVHLYAQLLSSLDHIELNNALLGPARSGTGNFSSADAANKQASSLPIYIRYVLLDGIRTGLEFRKLEIERNGDTSTEKDIIDRLKIGITTTYVFQTACALLLNDRLSADKHLAKFSDHYRSANETERQALLELELGSSGAGFVAAVCAFKLGRFSDVRILTEQLLKHPYSNYEDPRAVNRRDCLLMQASAALAQLDLNKTKEALDQCGYEKGITLEAWEKLSPLDRKGVKIQETPPEIYVFLKHARQILRIYYGSKETTLPNGYIEIDPEYLPEPAFSRVIMPEYKPGDTPPESIYDSITQLYLSLELVQLATPRIILSYSTDSDSNRALSHNSFGISDKFYLLGSHGILALDTDLLFEARLSLLDTICARIPSPKSSFLQEYRSNHFRYSDILLLSRDPKYNPTELLAKIFAKSPDLAQLCYYLTQIKRSADGAIEPEFTISAQLCKKALEVSRALSAHRSKINHEFGEGIVALRVALTPYWMNFGAPMPAPNDILSKPEYSKLAEIYAVLRVANYKSEAPKKLKKLLDTDREKRIAGDDAYLDLTLPLLAALIWQEGSTSDDILDEAKNVAWIIKNIDAALLSLEGHPEQIADPYSSEIAWGQAYIKGLIIKALTDKALAVLQLDRVDSNYPSFNTRIPSENLSLKAQLLFAKAHWQIIEAGALSGSLNSKLRGDALESMRGFLELCPGDIHWVLNDLIPNYDSPATNPTISAWIDTITGLVGSDSLRGIVHNQIKRSR